MKRKNLTLSVLFVASLLTLAGCGGETGEKNSSVSSSSPASSEKTTSSSTATTPSEKTIQYQYTGDSTTGDPSLAAYGFAYSYYINLYNDGTIDGGGYSIYSMDTRPAESNEHYYHWFTGRWGKGKDEDEEECLRLIVNYADGTKSVTGDPLTGKFTYYVYEEKGKLTDIDQFNVPIALSGRQLPITYHETPYQTADDFIKATSYHFAEPTEYLAKLEDTTNHQYIFAEKDGKAERFGSAIDPEDNTRKYYPTGASTSWSYSDSKLTFTINGTAHEATIGEDKKSITLAWEDVVSYGDQSSKTDYNFTCADGSKLLTGETTTGDTTSETHEKGELYFTYVIGGALKLEYSAKASVWAAGFGATGSYTPDETSSDNLFDFTCKDHDDRPLHILKNGTYSLSFSIGGYAIKKTGKYTFSHYSLVLTEDAAEGETAYSVTATMAH